MARRWCVQAAGVPGTGARPGSGPGFRFRWPGDRKRLRRGDERGMQEGEAANERISHTMLHVSAFNGHHCMSTPLHLNIAEVEGVEHAGGPGKEREERFHLLDDEVVHNHSY